MGMTIVVVTHEIGLRLVQLGRLVAQAEKASKTEAVYAHVPRVVVPSFWTCPVSQIVHVFRAHLFCPLRRALRVHMPRAGVRRGDGQLPVQGVLVVFRMDVQEALATGNLYVCPGIVFNIRK